MLPFQPPARCAERPVTRRPRPVRLSAWLLAAVAPLVAAIWHAPPSDVASVQAASAQELVRFVVNGSAHLGNPDARAWIKEIALDGTGRRLITSVPGTAFWASTSCADTLVVDTQDPQSRIFVVDRATGSWREHVAPPGGRAAPNVHTPAIHPAGTSMWFALSALPATGLVPGVWHASLVDATTSVVIPRQPGLELHSPAWSPRGDAVVLTASQSGPLGRSDLVLHDAQGRRIEPLTQLGDAKEGSLSPGATHLVFSRGRLDPAKRPQTSAIWLLERATGRTWPLVHEGRYDHHPVWSHDGSTIVFVRGGAWLGPALGGFESTATLMTVPARGGTPTPLGTLEYDLAMWPATCVAPEWDPAVPRPEPPADLDVPDCLCPVARRRLPASVLASAMANPDAAYGWNLPLDPGKPVSPINPRRRCLALLDEGEPYHYLGNPPMWRAGCRN